LVLQVPVSVAQLTNTFCPADFVATPAPDSAACEDSLGTYVWPSWATVLPSSPLVGISDTAHSTAALPMPAKLDEKVIT
jgi:hypothetical protein